MGRKKLGETIFYLSGRVLRFVVALLAVESGHEIGLGEGKIRNRFFHNIDCVCQVIFFN